MQYGGENFLKYQNITKTFCSDFCCCCNSKETIMCRNDELSWFGCLLTDWEIFILFAENSQILLKIFVIPIPLNFHVSGST